MSGRDDRRPDVAAPPAAAAVDNALAAALLAFPPAKEPRQLQPLVLAYVGDAVYELFVRGYVVSQPNHRPHHLHREATRFVSAKAQARALERWLPLLTDDELDVVKRGRNAKSGSAPKSADILDYRHSTAFECLIGFLYYRREWERLRSLLLTTVEPEQTK
ncbi:MAG: Mini-ribonuclease 3 [Paenibacillaceae bacterium]|nr:Mini-ribonuclease 3 [Paenibacillaceae bacterium]